MEVIAINCYNLINIYNVFERLFRKESLAKRISRGVGCTPALKN